MLAGVGMQEKAKEVVDELVKKGEMSESQGAKFIKEWSDQAEKSATDMNKLIHDAVSKAIESMPLATKTDMQKISKEIETLSDRVKKLEG